ncbi:MAG: TPM domain-containing protein [Lachnospiraceae bacterium]|nr:TPM domain-containing protein [Lachnospiraceae bacterium]
MKKHYNSNVSQFFGKFMVPMIIVAILLAGWYYMANIKKGANEYYDSPNTQRVYGDKRVFDYADKLTDAQERELEAYIHEAEKRTTCDIVIVTLYESLKDFAPDYMAKYDMTITPDKYVMVYADKFWEDNKFGYDQPQILDGTPYSGDGVLLVDNNFREPETGRIYTWMCTTGKVERKYSESMIDHALDVFYEYVDDDYYKACLKFVKQFEYDMTGQLHLTGSKAMMIIAAIYGLIYMLSHMSSRAGSSTVTESSYLIEGSLAFPVNRDTFIRKDVTKRYNPPSESRSGGGGGGGGGHHSSGGGGSHGGGGHSR